MSALLICSIRYQNVNFEIVTALEREIYLSDGELDRDHVVAVASYYIHERMNRRFPCIFTASRRGRCFAASGLGRA